jgi:gliding motility-associated-like protein
VILILLLQVIPVNINCNTELRLLNVTGSATVVSTNRVHRIGSADFINTNNNINFSGSAIKAVTFSTVGSPNVYNFSNVMIQLYDTLKSQFATNNQYISVFPIRTTSQVPSRKSVFTSNVVSLNMRSLHVFSNEFIKGGSNDVFDSVLIYKGNSYLTSIATSFSISPTGYFKLYPGTYIQHQYSPSTSVTSASVTIPASAKFVANGRCDSTIRFREVFFNFLSATPTATCNNLIIDHSRTSVVAGLNAGVNSYKIPGTTTTGWSFGAIPAARILRWTGTTTPPNTDSYARWHNSSSWQNVTTGITPECPPTIYDSVIFPNNSYVRIDNPMSVCKGMNWQGTGVFYDSATVVGGGPFGPSNTGVPIVYDAVRNLEIYGTTTLTKPNQLNWNFKGRVYFRAWQANQFLNPGQQIFRNSVIFDATSDLGGWVLQDSLYAHYSYEGQFGVGGVIFQSALVNESSHSLVHFNGHLNTNGYTVRACNYNKASRPIEYQSSLKLGKSKFYIIGKQYGNSVNYRTANFFIQRSTKFSVKADSSEIIYMPTVTTGGQPNLFFGGGYKFFNLTFKGNRGGITTGRNYSGILRAYTDTFNIITFENNAHIFASDVTSGTFAANVPPLTENIIAKRINFNTLSGYTEIGNTWTSGLLPSYTRSPIRILVDSVFYYGNASVDTTSIRYNNISVMYPGKAYNFYYSNHTYPTGSIMQGIGSCANTIVLNKGRFYNNSGADFENATLHLNYFKISEPASLGSDSLVFQNSFEVLPATGKAITRGGKSRVLVWRDGVSGISSGNWDDNSKWALATITNSAVPMGAIPFSYTVGSVGECVPTCADTIIFDNLSFDANDGIVLPDNYTAYFHTMRWATQAAITPSFTASMKKGATLNICGSLFLQNNLNFDNGAYTLFTGNTKRDTIDAKGKEVCKYVARFEANSDSVNWVLKSNALFSANGFTSSVQPLSGDSVNLQLVRGHLNINGYLLQTKLFHSTGTNYRKLSMPEITSVAPVRTSTLQVFGSNLHLSAANEAPSFASTNVVPNIGTVARFVYIVDDANTGKFQLNAAKNSLLLFQSLPTTTVSYMPSVKYGNNLHYGIVKFNNVATSFINGNCFRDTFELMEINPVVSQITTATNSFGSTNNRTSNTNNYIKKLVSKGTLSTAASFSISAVGTRIDSLLCEGGVTITDTTSIANYYKFVPNRTYSFPHNQVTYLFDNCDFKPIGTAGNNIFFVSTLSGSQAWIRKDTGLVCADFCSVVDNWAVGSGKSMPAFTTGGTFPGGSGIGIGACTQPNISRCDTVLASSYYTGTNSGPTLNASPAQNFGKRGIFNGGANFTIGSNTFGWEKIPNPPTPKVAVVSPNVTICEGDSLRITFQIEGFGPFKDFVYFSNTNVAGGYPAGSNITNAAPASIGIPSYTATPSFTYHPGVYPGDSIRPLDPSQPYATFGTTANPWMYSFWVYPTQSIKYSLGTIGVDRCFNAVSATGIGAMVVTVNPAPKNVSGSIISNPICANNAAVITGTATQTGNTYYLYDAPTGFTGQQVMTSSTTGTLTTGTYTTSSLTTSTTSTTYTYYVGAESQLGCPSLTRVPVTVTVNPIPQITNADIQAICTGNTATISPVNNFTTGVTNNWSSAAVAGITGHATTGSSSVTETLINTTTTPQTLVYTYTPTAAGCAGTTQQFTVTVNPAPTMSSPTNTTICSGNALSFNLNTNIPGSTFNWIASDNTNTTGETTTTQNASSITDAITNNATSLQIVTYSVIPTGTAGACPGVAQTVTVNINPTPALTSANTATLCSGGSVNIPLTANVASTYTWVANSNTNVTGESTTNQTANTLNNTLTTAVGSAPETVLYTITPQSSAGACLGTPQTVTVTVNSSPSVTAVSSNTAICSGNTATLTATGADTYTWTSGPTASTQTVNATGTYTVRGTNAVTGCTNTANVSVLVNPLPVVTANASSASICSGNTVTLTAGGAQTYTWTSPASTNTIIIVTPTAATIYTVNGTDANGCANSRTVSVAVNATPTVSITASSGTICSGQITTLTAATANAYNWSSGQAVNAITVAPTTNTVYTVIGTNTAGTCTASAQFSVTVNATPTVAISANSGTICSGQSTTLTAATANDYSWSSGETINTITVAPTTNTVYTVIGTNTAGTCTASAQYSVTVNTTPTVAITSSNATICNGQSTTLNLAGASTYTLLNDNTTITSGASVSPTTTTTYSIQGSTGTCTSSATQQVITVNPSPVVTATTSAAAICSGNTATLTAAGANTYTWSGGPTSATYTVNATNAYVVTGTDANNCVNTATVNLTVNPTPTVAISASSGTICSGQTTTLTAATANNYSWSSGQIVNAISVAPTTNTVYTVIGTNTAGTCTASAQYSVTVNTTPTVAITAANATICNGQSTSLNLAGANTYTLLNTGNPVTSGASVSPTTTTTYSIQGSIGTCTSATTQQLVTVNPLPTVTAVSNATTICVNQSATLTAGGAQTYTWTSPASTNTVITVIPTTTTSYVVMGTDANNCVNTQTVTLMVNQLPTITASTITNVTCFGANNGSVVFTPAAGTPTYAITGTSVTGTSATGLAPADYTYTVTDAAGCQNTTTLSITQPTAALAANAAVTATNSSCTNPNGAFAITATGGTSTYSYSIDGNAPTTNSVTTDLSSGPHTYVVTDANGCTTTTGTVNISGTPGITSSVSNKLDVVCYGNNTASVTVTGAGGSTYDYTLTPMTATTTAQSNTTGNFSNLSAGTYSVLVVDQMSNCISTNTITINTPTAALALTGITANSVVCNGGTAQVTATVTGGTPGYNYVWSSNTSTLSSATYTAGSYHVNINDANGCLLATQNFTVAEAPVLTIASVATTTTGCGLSNASATVTATGGWNIPNYDYVITSATATVSTTNTVTNLAAGTYSATITDALGCTTQTVFSISNPTTPTLNIASTTPAICAGETATLTPTGAVSYTLASTSATFATNTTVTPTTTTVYNITGTDASNCTSAPLSVTVTVNELPTINLASSNAAICVGQTATLTANTTGTTTVDTYTWSTASTTVNTTTVSPTAQTVYTVAGTNTLTGCVSAVQSVTVDVNALPTAAVASQTNVTCLGDANGTIILSSSSTNTTVVEPTVNLAAGDYTFTIVDNTTTCANTVSATIAAPTTSLAISSIATQTAACATANGSATITAIAGWGAPYTYSVNGSVVTGSVVTGLQANNYTAQVSDALGCVNSLTFAIVNPNAPVLSIASNTAVICSGQSVTLTPTGATNYTLGTITFTNNIVLTPGATTVVTITGTDASSCTSAPLTVTVTVNALPTISVAATSTAICSGNTSTLTANGADSYVWTSGPITADYVVTTAGTYTVVGTNSVTGCESAEAMITVTVGATPTVAVASQTNVLCFGNTNGAVDITTSATTLSITPATTSLTVGSYTFTITDLATTCTNTVAATIAGPTVALTAVVNNTTTNTSCATPNGAFTVTALGGTPNYTYNATNTTGVFVNQGTGTQNITVVDANGCTYTVSATIPGANTPSISAATQTNVLCNGGNTGAAGITVINGTPTYTYTWSNNAGLNSNTQANLPVGPYTVTATDAGSCTVTQAFIITEPSAINAITSNVTAPCVGQSNGAITIELIGGTPAYNVSWNPTGNISTSGNTSSINDVSEGQYIATITDANSCSYQYPVQLTAADGIGCTLQIPEIFSPNGDGKNDTWEIKGLENYPNNNVTVFNRWGDQVFKAEPYKNDWDGTNTGDKSILGKGALPAGTYYFILDLGNGDKPITGYVQITK